MRGFASSTCIINSRNKLFIFSALSTAKLYGVMWYCYHVLSWQHACVAAMHVCMRACVRACMCACVCVCARACVCVCVCACMHVCVHTCVCECLCAWLCVSIRAGIIGLSDSIQNNSRSVYPRIRIQWLPSHCILAYSDFPLNEMTPQSFMW